MNKPGSARRKLIKALAGVGAGAVAARQLPQDWTRPLVNHVLVPAHAQLSRVTGVYSTAGLVVADAGGSALDLLVSPAYATAPATVTADIHAEFVEGVASVVQVLIGTEEHSTGYYFTGSDIEIGAASATVLSLKNVSAVNECKPDNATASIRFDDVAGTANGTLYFTSVHAGAREEPFNLDPGGARITNPGDCTLVVVPSDRNLKGNFASVDPQSILERVANLPIETWNYNFQGQGTRHIGPMAQDFYRAFNVGEDDRHINMVDANGVVLAAIQALYGKVQEKDRQIEALARELEALRASSGSTDA
jgi:hypothetical protein